MKRRRKTIILHLFLCIMGLLLLSCAGTKKNTMPKPEDFVWPLPPAEPKIQFVKSIHSELALGPRKRSLARKIFEAFFGRPRLSALRKPLNVHVDKKDHLYVADSHWRKILIFDFKNKKLDILGKSGRGMLLNPLGVTTDDDGIIYVTDAGGQRVVLYNPDYSFRTAFGGKNVFVRPAGIAVNSKLNLIYVVDTWAHQVKVFDRKSHKYLFTIGRHEKEGKKISQGSLDQTWNRSSDPGEFDFPTNIAIDSLGNIYIVDTMNFRVQVLDPRGHFLLSFGKIGNVPGTFSRPKGIALDNEGHIYVADAAFNNIQIFNKEGKLLLYFGSFGSGLADLRLPAGMYIDRHDRIYVADQLNHRIQVYQFLGGKSKATNKHF